MITQFLKYFAKETFKEFGLEIRRTSEEKNIKIEEELPPLFDDPLEALTYQQSGKFKNASFKCPLKFTVKQNGLSYSPEKWHPFVETLREFGSGIATQYEGSILEKYYELHQPANAAKAIVGLDNVPTDFRVQPAHVYKLTPWRSETASKIDESVKKWTRRSNVLYGKNEINFETDGFQYHGPVSPKKGRLEFERLVTIYKSIRKNGFDRTRGHANFLLLRRGNSYRFLAQGDGNHRTAAMAALGYETIPAVFQRPVVIDISMADYWPQVCNGIWNREQAIVYFNHLFDFDSRAWARDRGLLTNGISQRSEKSTLYGGT